MKVKVTWVNKNPFCPRLEDFIRSSTAEIDDNTSFEQIEHWANDATPRGYWLSSIDTPTNITTYTPQGEVIL